MKLKNFSPYLVSAVLPAAALVFLGAGGDVSSGLSSSGLASHFPTIIGGLGALTGNSIVDLIVFIIRILLLISGAIAVLFVIIGGFRYITSAGNEEAAEKGKNTLVNAIIGIIVVTLAYVIINVVVNTVSNGTLF